MGSTDDRTGSAATASPNRGPSWGDRFEVWRMRWFPYRAHRWLGPNLGFSRPVWQWPNVLGKDSRG